MELILSHINLDLDGLASMLIAKKLYPDARLVFSGSLNTNVKDLVGLYQHYLNIYKASEIKMKHISKLIIVDTSSLDKIGKFKEICNDDLEIIVYDHHKIKEDNKIRDKGIVKSSNYGSNTTFLLEELIKKEGRVEFKPYEPSIFMMGIYEDTGSLSFTNTTVNDIKMAAFLLENGANLKMVNEYIRKSLEEKQIKIFLDLMQTGEVELFSFDSVFFGKYYTDDFIAGFDVIVNKIKDLEGVSGAFVLCGNDEKSYLIGRSSTINIRVNEVMKKFGGGGHEKIYSEMKNYVISNLKSNKLAKDIMQKPVKTVTKKSKLKDAYKTIIRFAYGGLPVVENGKIVGLITRREIDKAMMHGFGNAPVKAYMAFDAITVKPDCPMEILKKIMIENDIGRVPVVNENGKILGIVTRTDILRNIYEQRKRTLKEEIKFEENIKNTIKENIDTFIYEKLEKIEEVSQVRKEKAYLVGGIVRDMILGIKNIDVDIVVEGDGIAFAKELGEKLKAAKVVVHEKFGTGVVVLEDGFKIDVASSRVEYYEYPTSLPTVESGNIKQDLYRRDFTINAMAVEIDYADFGKLIDYFKGYDDLNKKKIRVLHNLSFVEDPTRIIRGIRFAVRYDFDIEESTHKFMIDAIEKGFLEKLTWKRVKEELKIILSEKNSKKAVYKLFEYGILRAVHPNISLSDKMKEDIENLEKNTDLIAKLNIEKWIIYFLLLLEELTTDELNKVFEKFVFNGKFIRKYNYGRLKREEICQKISNKEVKPSEVYKILSDLAAEIIFLIFLTSRNLEVKNNIVKYIDSYSKQDNIIDGKDLIALGIKKGPQFRKILQYAFSMQLDYGMISKEKILDKIKKKYMK